MGRPRKQIKRTEIIRVRFTLVEYKLLTEYALRSSQTIASFIRARSLGYSIKSRLSKDDVEILRLLIGVANNLNQYMKLTHAKVKGTSNVLATINKISEIIQKLK
jgi:hypothetical protein